ncbi:MAG: sigma-54-dependent Fis family transcriptional regulator [Ignavibacteriae bacterium]|nr:sigma-54-dependent Fis family transcriptional regulator [Ignavibacteriota bacterium]NOG96434.1 sigma-54-dependent Fis family transcriptional regulator [Ignavibacteriota bacterium]
MIKIIVIEDERIKRITMSQALKKANYHVNDFGNPVVALKYFKNNGADLVISDIRMEDLDGFEVLEKVKQINSATDVILMTAFGTIESAVNAMKKGAYDFITKPFSSEELILLVQKYEKLKNLLDENILLKKILEDRYSFHNLIGKSKVMIDLFDQIEMVSSSEMSVLIEGESGTGKEVVANAIHYNSDRKEKPFIKLSCAALNESLLESELFGHEKGAFTGAYKEKQGRFEVADGGTLFLDDIDDIPLSSQVKLLRVLQEREFERVGATKPTKVNVRIICATKVDLWELVEKKQFREDLFYRLRVIPIRIPPLRERKEDIPLLVEHFLIKSKKEKLHFTPEALELLTCYNWPGNIRQLENAVYRISAFTKTNEVTRDMIPEDLICGKEQPIKFSIYNNDKIDLQKFIEKIEKETIEWALARTDHNQSKAAEILKLKRTTLRDKMKKFDVH